MFFWSQNIDTLVLTQIMFLTFTSNCNRECFVALTYLRIKTKHNIVPITLQTVGHKLLRGFNCTRERSEHFSWPKLSLLLNVIEDFSTRWFQSGSQRGFGFIVLICTRNFSICHITYIQYNLYAAYYYKEILRRISVLSVKLYNKLLNVLVALYLNSIYSYISHVESYLWETVCKTSLILNYLSCIRFLRRVASKHARIFIIV